MLIVYVIVFSFLSGVLGGMLVGWIYLKKLTKTVDRMEKYLEEDSKNDNQ